MPNRDNPTDPATPLARQWHCPECGGAGFIYVPLSCEGEPARACSGPCAFCAATGRVSLEQYREWWVARNGPEETR
jgi:hypothetical protein